MLTAPLPIEISGEKIVGIALAPTIAIPVSSPFVIADRAPDFGPIITEPDDSNLTCYGSRIWLSRTTSTPNSQPPIFPKELAQVRSTPVASCLCLGVVNDLIF